MTRRCWNHIHIIPAAPGCRLCWSCIRERKADEKRRTAMWLRVLSPPAEHMAVEP